MNYQNHKEVKEASVQLVNKMSKPIFIIRLPSVWGQERIEKVRESILKTQGLSDDYYIFVLGDAEVENVKFEMFNSPHTPNTLENITRLTEMSIERCIKQEEQRKRLRNE
jgi:hypothetical protein